MIGTVKQNHDKSHLNSAPCWLVNDIAWLASETTLLESVPASPSLIRKTCTDLIGAPPSFSEEQLLMLDAKQQGPLGRYCEALVQTVISRAPEVTKLHPNVVIRYMLSQVRCVPSLCRVFRT